MAFQLKNGETKTFEAHFHWSNYVSPALWAGMMLLLAILLLQANARGYSAGVPLVCIALVVGLLPFGYRVLQNKTKKYILTNQRIFVEHGILAKTRIDIPYAKINDTVMKQGILQRLLGSGDVVVFTGNDKALILSGLDCPNEFMEKISDHISKKVA